VYGLLNYWVTAREEEIAIRQALGASRSRIVGWAGAAASKLIGAGLAIGLLAAWAAAHALDSLVFGISSRDAGTMIAAALVVIGIATVAASPPLWRATRVDARGKLQRA